MSDSRGKKTDAGIWNPAMAESAPPSLIPLAPEPLYRSGLVVSRSAADLESILPPVDAQKTNNAYLSSTALHPSDCDLPPLGDGLPPLMMGAKSMPMKGVSVMSMSMAAAKPVSDVAVDALAGWVPPPAMVMEATGVQELPRMHVPHLTVAMAGVAPEDVLAALPQLVLQAAAEVHLEPQAADVFAVKGEVAVGHCMAGFALDVYAHEGGSAVELRRTFGDSETWHAFFTAATAQCRVQYPEARMLGGWSGGFPEKSSLQGPAMTMAALPPLPPLPPLDEEAEPEPPSASPQLLTPRAMDGVERELKAHTEFSGDAVAELAQAVDAQVVGADNADANVMLVLHHASLVETLIGSVLRYTHDAPVVRGALFVLHRCCEGEAEQRRFVSKPLTILTKLLPLLEGNHIVVQHALRLLSRLAPEVDGSYLGSSLDVSSADGRKWSQAINAACRNVAQYAQGAYSLVTEEMLAAVRRLVPAQ